MNASLSHSACDYDDGHPTGSHIKHFQYIYTHMMFQQALFRQDFEQLFVKDLDIYTDTSLLSMYTTIQVQQIKSSVTDGWKSDVFKYTCSQILYVYPVHVMRDMLHSTLILLSIISQLHMSLITYFKIIYFLCMNYFSIGIEHITFPRFAIVFTKLLCGHGNR